MPLPIEWKQFSSFRCVSKLSPSFLTTGSSSAARTEREHLTKFFLYISIYFQQILFRLMPFFLLYLATSFLNTLKDCNLGRRMQIKSKTQLPQGWWLNGMTPVWYHKSLVFKPIGEYMKALLCPVPLGLTWV